MLHELNPYGDLSGLSLDEIMIAPPGEGEVRLKVDAFSLNYGDFELFAGHYTFGLTLPGRIGGECAGVIESIGKGVTGLKVGDRVCTLPSNYDGYGVNGEYALFPADNVTRYPDNLTPEEACCIWVAHMTAYFALNETAKVQEDEYVLITAASSSAGMAAMEYCKMVGAKTIGTSRTGTKRQYLLDLGFDYVIAQDEGDMSERIMEFSGGVGARVIYDPIGGKIVQDYKDALAQNALIILYGGMDQGETIVPEIEMTRKAAFFHCFSTFNHIGDKASLARGVKFVFEGLADGHLKSRVDKVYSLADFRQAFEDQLNSTTRTGKMVVLGT